MNKRSKQANNCLPTPISFASGFQVTGTLPFSGLQSPLAFTRQYIQDHAFVQERSFTSDADICVTELHIFSLQPHVVFPRVRADVNELVFTLCAEADCEVENFAEQLRLRQSQYTFGRIPSGLHRCYFPARMKSFLYIQFSNAIIDQLLRKYPQSGTLHALKTARDEQRPELVNADHQLIDEHMAILLLQLRAINGRAKEAPAQVRAKALEVIEYALYRCARPQEQVAIAYPLLEQCLKASRAMGEYANRHRGHWMADTLAKLLDWARLKQA